MFKFQNIRNYTYETRLYKKRLIKAIIAIAMIFALLIGRLVYLQLYKHQTYTNLSQHNETAQLLTEPNRGLIYDRNGVLLAENIPVFSLAIIPDYVTDIDQTIEDLGKIIDISPENIQQFKKALTQHQRFEHIPLKIKLTQDELDNFYVNQYRFPGVVIDANMIRHYPLADIMANVLGYVGRITTQDLKNIDSKNYAANNFIGKIGIEKYYESQLHGKAGYQQVNIDATGHVVKIIKNEMAIPGDNLYLTIDSALQKAAIDALENEKGAVVAINPQNGEVLALVSKPSYDPNLFVNGIDPKIFQQIQKSPEKPMFNRALRGLFPFASTIKPFIALEGLDGETININTSIIDPGWFKLPMADHIYRDWQHSGHGIVNITKAIVESCDTFFYNLAVKLGIDKVDDILERFGFGHLTGIDLFEELPGIVASPKWKMHNTGKSWYLGDTVISGIGQGFMSATPLQLAAGVATIAEHGIRYQPHLLLKREQPDGITIDQKSIKVSPVILKNNKNWNVVISAMQQVIKSATGTAHKHFGDDMPYTVAGKTGGAQLYHHKDNNENATEENEANIPKRLRNHSLFIAFAPIENPQIAIAVVVENSTLAPIVTRRIIDSYLHAPPRKPKPEPIKPASPTPTEQNQQPEVLPDGSSESDEQKPSQQKPNDNR